VAKWLDWLSRERFM